MRQFAARSERAVGLKLGWLLTILALGTGFAVSTCAAEAPKSTIPISLFEAEFSLAIGGFFPRIESDISLGPSSGGSGETIDSESDLGLSDDTASAWVEFDWRFLPRHQFQAEWFQLNRDGSTAADRDFTYGDMTAFAGANVSSKSDLDLWRLTYGYSIIRNEKFDLAFLVGTHIATAKATVSASGSIAINGVPVANGAATVSSSTYTFPLPHIGGAITYKLSPKWSTQFNVLFFALDTGDYQGSLIQFDAMAGYQINKHFGLGAGLKYFNLSLEGQTDRVNAGYDYEFFGPAIFGYTTF